MNIFKELNKTISTFCPNQTKLKQTCKEAEQYFSQKDYAVAGSKLRICLEEYLQQLINTTKKQPALSTNSDKIQFIFKHLEKKLPENFLNHVNLVKNIGNFFSHNNELKNHDAYLIAGLSSLEYLILHTSSLLNPNEKPPAKKHSETKIKVVSKDKKRDKTKSTKHSKKPKIKIKNKK